MPAGCQNSASGAELGFYAARSYSLWKAPPFPDCGNCVF